MNETFGFGWFAPENIGEEATLKLNGRRIMLRSAISWGYWPVTGLIATPEMAEKQITTAKQLGLNMLNFHRNITELPLYWTKLTKWDCYIMKNPALFIRALMILLSGLFYVKKYSV